MANKQSKPEETRDNPKEHARRRKNEAANRRVVLFLAGVGVVLLVLLAAGIVQALVITPRQPVATVNGNNITLAGLPEGRKVRLGAEPAGRGRSLGLQRDRAGHDGRRSAAARAGTPEGHQRQPGGCDRPRSSTTSVTTACRRRPRLRQLRRRRIRPARPRRTRPGHRRRRRQPARPRPRRLRPDRNAGHAAGLPGRLQAVPDAAFTANGHERGGLPPGWSRPIS